jgi:L-alanine-DL-glutamate epimerase-like enolase superfamily enzyme
LSRAEALLEPSWSRLQAFSVYRFEVDLARPYGDHSLTRTSHEVGALELVSTSGDVGLGLFGRAAFFGAPIPPLGEVERVFRATVWPALEGQPPAGLLNAVRRPRSWNPFTTPFAEAIDQALWDLVAKEQRLPLYRLLGGRDGRVPVYASGVDFPLGEDELQALYAEFSRAGFRAFKVKVGHEDVRWDIRRLEIVSATVGADAILMVDANEAWPPKEAVRRLEAYRASGFEIYWVEDPCLRNDLGGLEFVKAATPAVLLNCGEYVGVEGKLELVRRRIPDVLNVHGFITESMIAGRAAATAGLPVTVGNTQLDVGVHVAAALPEVLFMEYSALGLEALVEEPIRIADGYAHAPDRPGHGLVLSSGARDGG